MTSQELQNKIRTILKNLLAEDYIDSDMLGMQLSDLLDLNRQLSNFEEDIDNSNDLTNREEVDA